MKTTTSNTYRKRLCNVIDYIYQHLDADLDVNQLADVATMSPYHFHRIYREMAQETVNTTVRRLRLQHAASALIRTELKVLTIARDVSYGSKEAFSRAFTKEFNLTPSEYRLRHKAIPETERLENPEPEHYISRLPIPKTEMNPMFNVDIIDIEATHLIGYQHEGDYMKIGRAFEKLFLYAGSHGKLAPHTRSIGLYYHDPKTIDTENLRSTACITIDAPITDQEKSAPQNLSIPAGKCATVLFKGSYAELERPYDWLFGCWLPESGLEAADHPPFEEYLNDPKTTPPHELLTRIHCLLT